MTTDDELGSEAKVLARTRLPGQPVVVLVERSTGARVLASIPGDLDAAIGDRGHIEPGPAGFTFRPAEPA